MHDAWLQMWLTFLIVSLAGIIYYGIRWLIDVLPDLWDWLADWQFERRNRKAIRQLWRTYGRKPPRGL